MIYTYTLMTDYELERRITDREYLKNSIKEFLLRKDLPISLRGDLSLELQLLRKDLTRLYDERNLRGKNPNASMLSQSHLEVEVEG